MKRKNKFLALLLAASLSFSVSACGSADTGKGTGTPSTEDASTGNDDVDVYAAAQEKMKDVKSMNAKMSVEMNIDISANGESQSMETTTTMDMSCLYDPLLIKVDMDIDAGDAGKTTMSTYMEADENGTCTLYMYDGADWVSQTVELGDMQQYDAASNITSYMKDSYNFQDAGTEQVDGKATRKYTGVITGDDMQETIMSTGALNSLNSLGMDVSQMESMFDDLEGLPITFWIDEAEFYPVKYEMDMAPLMNSLMSAMIEAMGDEAEGVTMEFTKMDMVMTCSDYNSVAEFSIPDDVKAASPAA